MKRHPPINKEPDEGPPEITDKMKQVLDGVGKFTEKLDLNLPIDSWDLSEIKKASQDLNYLKEHFNNKYFKLNMKTLKEYEKRR